MHSSFYNVNLRHGEKKSQLSQLVRKAMYMKLLKELLTLGLNILWKIIFIMLQVLRQREITFHCLF